MRTAKPHSSSAKPYCLTSDRSLTGSLFHKIRSLLSHECASVFPMYRLMWVYVWRLCASISMCVCKIYRNEYLLGHVCLSSCVQEKVGSKCTCFRYSWFFRFFPYPSWVIQVPLQSARITATFLEHFYIFMNNFSLISSYNEKYFSQRSREN